MWKRDKMSQILYTIWANHALKILKKLPRIKGSGTNKNTSYKRTKYNSPLVNDTFVTHVVFTYSNRNRLQYNAINTTPNYGFKITIALNQHPIWHHHWKENNTGFTKVAVNNYGLLYWIALYCEVIMLFSPPPKPNVL